MARSAHVVTFGVVGIEQVEAFEPPIASVTIADERRTRETSMTDPGSGKTKRSMRVLV
jgi:hypothetical protein